MPDPEPEMSLALLMSLQAATVPEPPVPASMLSQRIDFDLARLGRSGFGDARLHLFCAGSTETEVVVCARRGGRTYPLEEMARVFEHGPVRAEMGIGGGAFADVHVEAANMPDGTVSNRVMVGIRIPF